MTSPNKEYLLVFKTKSPQGIFLPNYLVWLKMRLFGGGDDDGGGGEGTLV